MFSLDLAEIETVAKQILFISRNRFNAFIFRDKDHLQVKGTTGSIRDQLIAYAEQQGIDSKRISRIQLLTNLCTLGYQFNPVSFYFCFDENEQPICSIVEVCNTFGEMKLYLLGTDTLSGNSFNSRKVKHFYVSPFIDLDTEFDFRLHIPNDSLNIRIEDYQDGRRFLLTTLVGKSKTLNNWNVLMYAFRFPLIPLQIITLIHWQAFKLWMKKIKYHKKNSFIELQQDVLKPHKSLLN